MAGVMGETQSPVALATGNKTSDILWIYTDEYVDIHIDALHRCLYTMSISIYLSIYVFKYLSIYLSIYLSQKASSQRVTVQGSLHLARQKQSNWARCADRAAGKGVRGDCKL